MSEHTPGPWELIDERQGFVVTDPSRLYDVAVVRNIGRQDNAANAHLIAAAPDLLSALEAAVELLDQLVKWNRIPANSQALRDARNAIAKASGSAS